MDILAMGAGSDSSLGVAVSHLLFAQRAVDSTGNGVTDPDDGSQQDDRKGELKGIDHESVLP